MSGIARAWVVTLLLFLAPQDVDKARALLQQALTALQPAPVVVVIQTPAQLDAALATAAPGAVLTLSRTLVYPTALTLTKAVMLQAEGLSALTRMDATTPLPAFQDGIAIPGNVVTLIGLQVTKRDPSTDIVVVSGANITLDRLRILGDPIHGAKRGIAANGNGAAQILRSYIDDCFQPSPGNDSQAIAAWDMAPGLVIQDNFLRGGSETLLLGGSDSSTAARMPSQIVIAHNTITKRPEWQRLPIGVKNTLEIKAARTVTITENDVSYSWTGGQGGYLLLLTVRNQNGTAPWSTIEDVTITGNRFSHGSAAINILGTDNDQPSGRMARVTIRGNTFSDLNPVTYAGADKMIVVGSGPVGLTIDANTFTGQALSSQVYFYGAPPALGFVLTTNRWPATTYGIIGDGTAPGAATWAAYTSGGTLSGNVVQP